MSGPAGDPANQHIPNISFPDPDPADFTDVDGIPTSRRTFLLIFKNETTVGQANALLQSYTATIIGAIPDFALLYLKLPDMQISQTMNLFEQFQTDSRVAAAVMDPGGMVEQQLPPFNVATANNLWTWDVPPYPGGPAGGGNWALELIRAPQMWNVDTFEIRHPNKPDGTANTVCAGVAALVAPDTGHPDLVFGANTSDGNQDHTTMSTVTSVRQQTKAGCWSSASTPSLARTSA